MDEKNKNNLIEKQDAAVEENNTFVEEADGYKAKIISPGRMVLKRFFRSKLSVIGLVTLIVLFAFAFIGPLFSPYGEIESDNSIGQKKEANITQEYTQTVSGSENLDLILDTLREQGLITQATCDSAKSSLIKVKYQTIYDAVQKSVNYFDYKYTDEDGNAVTERINYTIENDKGNFNLYIVEQVGTEDSPKYEKIKNLVITYTFTINRMNVHASPSLKHWLGTDVNAFDVFTRLMYAGRISLTLGFVVVFIVIIIGVILGGLSGFFGKWVDQLIMRICDIINCLPGLPMMLIFSAIIDGAQVDQGLRIYLLMAMLSLLSWTGVARMVRGQILNLREQEFMVAAEALGLSIPRRIFKHLIPNIMPLLIVNMTMSLGGMILTESTLSYLGLGIGHPKAAWGTMIASANDPIILSLYPNEWLPAGVVIILAVLAFNFVGDGLRDAFDPKMKR